MEVWLFGFRAFGRTTGKSHILSLLVGVSLGDVAAGKKLKGKFPSRQPEKRVRCVRGKYLKGKDLTPPISTQNRGKLLATWRFSLKFITIFTVIYT